MLPLPLPLPLLLLLYIDGVFIFAPKPLGSSMEITDQLIGGPVYLTTDTGLMTIVHCAPVSRKSWSVLRKVCTRGCACYQNYTPLSSFLSRDCPYILSFMDYVDPSMTILHRTICLRIRANSIIVMRLTSDGRDFPVLSR